MQTVDPNQAVPTWAVEAQSRDWLNSAASWGDFIGWTGQPSPFTVPLPSQYQRRFGNNVTTFLSNYAIVAGATSLLLALQHPWVVIVSVASVGGFYFASRYVQQNELAVEVGGRRLGAGELNVAFAIVLAAVLMFLTASTLLQLWGISSLIVVMHASFRNRVVPEGPDGASPPTDKGVLDGGDDDVFVDEAGRAGAI